MGSFTQFIFRHDLCACDKPAWLESPPQIANQTAVMSQFEDEIGDENIELNPKLFPLERYKPLKVISEGATEGFYVCKDLVLDKLVAVKVLHSMSDQRLIEFQNEARILSKIDDPEKDRILDFGATKLGAYQVLEFKRNESVISENDDDTLLNEEEPYENNVSVTEALSSFDENKKRNLLFAPLVVTLLLTAGITIALTGKKSVGGEVDEKIAPPKKQMSLPPPPHTSAKKYRIWRTGEFIRLEGEDIDRQGFRDLAKAITRPSTIMFDNEPQRIDWSGLPELFNRPVINLNVPHTTFSDRECKVVSKMPQLKGINLTATKVTNKGIDYLCQSKTINRISIVKTSTTSDCLKSLSKVPRLISLEIDAMPGVTQSDLLMLSRFEHLNRLSVSHIAIGDIGFRTLCKGPELVELNADGCGITDNGTIGLVGSSIQKLSITHNDGITDRSIPHFQKMSKLKKLIVGIPSKITPAGEQRLQKAKPKLLISHESGIYLHTMADDATGATLDGIKLLDSEL